MNILENGSAEQKADLLPKLAKGELMFAYGLSEPDVGGVPRPPRRAHLRRLRQYDRH
jgi:alkylation response protein AidB-like acyl-CoA dehydrogenase